jgi:hypothetical protein
MLEYLKTKAQRDAFLDRYDNFLFDCDGMMFISAFFYQYIIDTFF